MDDKKKEEQKDSNPCDLPETMSISERVHKHLKDENDHITDEDIRNADIDPNANELDDLHKDDMPTDEQDINRENKKSEEDQVTPWDVVNKDATE